MYFVLKWSIARRNVKIMDQTRGMLSPEQLWTGNIVVFDMAYRQACN